MAKPQRVRRMNADDFADFCLSATAREVQSALEAGSDWDGRALIYAASSNTDPNVIWAILREASESGVRLINARLGESKQTALHWAAGHNDNPDVVRVLISAGADVNAKDIHGQTPLGEAEAVHRMRWKDNRLQVIDMLKKAGGR